MELVVVDGMACPQLLADRENPPVAADRRGDRQRCGWFLRHHCRVEPSPERGGQRGPAVAWHANMGGMPLAAPACSSRRSPTMCRTARCNQ